MTVIEFLGFFFGIICAIIGGKIGFSSLGWLGLIIGIPLGLIGGYIIGVGIFGIIAFLGITKERLEQRRKLRGVFGKYWSQDRKDKWESLTKQFKQGQEVSGRVVCRFYYGVFVDTGQGFPALLNIVDSKNGNEPQAKIGSVISARTLRLDASESIIELTQQEKEAAETPADHTYTGNQAVTSHSQSASDFTKEQPVTAGKLSSITKKTADVPYKSPKSLKRACSVCGKPGEFHTTVNGPASMGDYFCDDHIPGPGFNLVNLVALLIMLGLLFGIGRLIYRWLY